MKVFVLCSFLLFCNVNCQTLYNVVLHGDHVDALTASKTHLYAVINAESRFDRPLYLSELTFDLESSRNLSISHTLISEDVNLIYDPTREYLYITSGWKVLTVDLSTFSILYEGWGGSNFQSNAAFTTDFNTLYIAARVNHTWGFTQLSLPDLTFIQRNVIQSINNCVPNNSSFFYGQSFWCDSLGESYPNTAICYGKVFNPHERFKVYQIDLNTWTSSAYTFGYMIATTKVGNPGVYITQDVGKQLLIEGTDNNLNRDWATIVSDIEEYETGIVASENYVFVTGRIWGDQETGTIVRIQKSDPSNQIFLQMPGTICGTGEEMNPMVAVSDNMVFAVRFSNEGTNMITKFAY